MSTTKKKINWRSYSDFFDKHKATYKNYQKYGEIVLEKDLAEDLDGENSEFLEIFTESNTAIEFEEKIKLYWIKHHRFIIENLSDIAKVYDIFKNSVDVRKVDKYLKNTCLDPVIIMDTLFDYIDGHKTYLHYGDSRTVLLQYDNYIYELRLNKNYFEIYDKYNVDDVLLYVPK